MLRDALKSLLLSRSEEEWDVVLPQIMRAYHSTPYSSTQETPNLLMIDQETRVPEHLTYHAPASESPVHEYVGRLIGRMEETHDALREKQRKVRIEDSGELPLYQVGDWVWMVSHHRHSGQLAKLQPNFMEPYCVVEVLPNRT